MNAQATYFVMQLAMTTLPKNDSYAKWSKASMEISEKEMVRPFISLLDAYDQSFYSRSIDDFRSLHVADKRVVFFDNHENCDSSNYAEHEGKVEGFFRSGEIGEIIRENVRVFLAGEMACITATLRYATMPRPGVRTTYVLELENGSWKIRHMHHSFDPNEVDNTA